MNEYLTSKLIKAFKHTKIKKIRVDNVDSNTYNVFIKFKDDSSILIKLDHDGLFILINKVKLISYNKKYSTVVVNAHGIGKINFSKLIAIEMGFSFEEINKIEFVNKDRMDFRFCNINVIQLVERSNSVYKLTGNLVAKKSLNPDNRGGYIKSIYSYDNSTDIVEFKNELVTVQTLIDSGMLEKLDLDKFYLSFSPKLNEYRVVYGSGKYKEPITRVMLNYKGSLFVDHINRDTLDNRKINLRLANRSINGHNRSKQNNREYIKGVFESDFRDGDTPRYIVAYICVNGVKQQEHFSVKKFGYINAIKMATNRRREWNTEYNVEED